MATTDFRGFAKALGEGDRYWVAELAAADRLVLTEDGKRVDVDASLAKLRSDSRPPIAPYRTASLSGFARALGCQPSYVTELKEAGRLVLTEDGKRVHVDQSLALIRDTADPDKAGVAARHAAKRGQGAATPAPGRQAPASAPEDADDQDQEAPVGSFVDPVSDSHARRRSKAQADKAEADARKALRDEQVELGQLLPAEAVEHAVRGAVVTFRGALENLPNTIAPELAAISDEGRVRVVLAEALEHALEELARKFGQLAKADES